MYSLDQPEAYAFRGRLATVAEHLGYGPNDKLLIINADDLGLSIDVNLAVSELFQRSRISSTTVMVTAAAYQDALAHYRKTPDLPCGVHLSLTSDYVDDGSRPISDPASIPSLVDRDGRFHPSRDEFFEHALPEEAYREAKAQIDLALADGIDVTHIDSHEGTLQLRAEFAEIYVRLAAEFRLPIRSGSRSLLRQMGILEDWAGRVRVHGIHVPDNLIYIPIDEFRDYQGKEKHTLEVLAQLPAGITEIYFHPTLPDDSADGRATESYRQARQWDYRLLMSDHFQGVLRDKRIIVTDFGRLRTLTRQT